MLQKWKIIITNWINCYFNESTKTAHHVDIESLSNIISHLRENLNLDESKSSRFEAHTVKEFVLEKFPEVKFENGTVEAASEDEVYLMASLLLFFVCVNSKDVGIKTAMCSKLSADDQEIILKFSKSLMECSPITCREVQAAIVDACGGDVVSMDAPQVTVAETPPALRSLHSEVRRLQAALDAERFDRNFLQEELSRTNIRLEKLVKDKEQYKLDIVNLKAKISMCCGQEHESKASDSEIQNSARLNQQLEDLEVRLVKTQEQLDDAIYERDAYKAKIDELKQDRDKWLMECQQESARAGTLAEELECERKNMAALRELVNELRQHNRLNRFDSSLLECDDPDNSIQSLQNNLSVCSEACANVVEVQLSEEKAKVEALKQQLQSLQEELHDLQQKFESEKQSYENTISQRENEIFDLKHRINEEIEEKNALENNYHNETVRLSNEVNELEQNIKDNNEQFRITINNKMDEIKILQEEKISLIQSFTDENTKYEKLISDLKNDLDSEKQSRVNMRESYENKLMKLNEKVLNRNNELVELQNHIFKKGETIETLQIEIRKEKALSNKYQTNFLQLEEDKKLQEANWNKKIQELNSMLQQLEQNISSRLKEIDFYKQKNSDLEQHCMKLETAKAQLEDSYNKCVQSHGEYQKEVENMKHDMSANIENLESQLDEKNATINTLQTHLQDEINFKIGLQEELQKLNTTKTYLSEELNKLNMEYSKLKIELTGKDRTIEAIDLYLKDEKQLTEKLKENIVTLNVQLDKMAQEIADKDNTIQQLNTIKTTFEKEISDMNVELNNTKQELTSMLAENEFLKSTVDSTSHEKSEKCKELLQLQSEYENLSKTCEEFKKGNRTLNQNITKEKHKYSKLEKTFDEEMSKVIAKLNESEKKITDLSNSSTNAIKNKECEIQTLQKEIQELRDNLEQSIENATHLYKAKEALSEKLSEEISYKTKIEQAYLSQCKQLEDVTSQLNNELTTKTSEINATKEELQKVIKIDEKRCEVVKSLEDLVSKANNEYKDLEEKLSHSEAVMCQLQQEIKDITQSKQQEIEAMQKQNEQLQFAIKEINNNHEMSLKEQKCIIEKLEQQLQNETTLLESLRKDYECVISNWEKNKHEFEESIQSKDRLINELEDERKILKNNIDVLQSIKDELTHKIETITKMMEGNEEKYQSEIITLHQAVASLEEVKVTLQNEFALEKAAKDTLETERNQQIEDIKLIVKENNELLNDKMILTQQLSEERSVKKMLEIERNKLFSAKSVVDNQLLEEIAKSEALVQDIAKLTNEKQAYEKQLDIIERDKKALVIETERLTELLETSEEKNISLSTLTETLAKDKEILTQQIIEERSARDLTEKEKGFLKDLLQEKEIQAEYKEQSIIQEMHSMKENHNILEQQYIKENETLKEEKEKLVFDLLEQNTIQELLINDKESLSIEKEKLLRSLEDEKAAHDELQNEKQQLNVKLEDLSEKFTSNVNNQKAELDAVNNQIKELQKASKTKEEFENQLSTNLTNGLVKLMQSLKKEGINNELLQKLIDEENSDIPIIEKCDLLINIANTLSTEIVMRKNLEKTLEHENTVISEMKDVLNQKEMQVFELQTEVKKLQQAVNENKIELSKRSENYNTALDTKGREIQALQKENQSLTNDLNDVKIKLEVKVHSLKEKLIDNENLTDKLKRTYECQIENLNVMITKLTSYLKDKTVELEALRKEKDKLSQNVEDSNKAIKLLEEEVKVEKQNQEKLINDFESERQVLKNMVSVTESVMEDQKTNFNGLILDHVKTIETLQEENRVLQENFDIERSKYEEKLVEKTTALESLFKDLAEVRLENTHLIEQEKKLNNEVTTLKNELQNILIESKTIQEKIETETNNNNALLKDKDTEIQTLLKDLENLKVENSKLKSQLENYTQKINVLKEELQKKLTETEVLVEKNKTLESEFTTVKSQFEANEKELDELKIKQDFAESEFKNKVDDLTKEVEKQTCTIHNLVSEKTENDKQIDEKVKDFEVKVNNLEKEREDLIKEKNDYIAKIGDILTTVDLNITKDNEEITALKKDKDELLKVVEDNKTVIAKLVEAVEVEQNEVQKLRNEAINHLTLVNKCDILQEYHNKAEKELEERRKEIVVLEKEAKTLQAKTGQAESELLEKNELIKSLEAKVSQAEDDSKAKDSIISKMSKEKDAIIASVSKDLLEERALKEQYKKELEEKLAVIIELRKSLSEINNDREALNILRKENEELIKAVGQRDTFAAQNDEKQSYKLPAPAEKEPREHQVSNTSDLTHTSTESFKTITDLEKIIEDKNRNITTLQSDVTYLKTLMAESETKLLDVAKELKDSKDNSYQLCNQLKKVVQQKNDEIADLKKQISKMSVNDNRATQIIRVSAKYQAIIFKRLAEIKSNNILQELTNFGNSNSCDNDLRRSLSAGSVTMEDLENFLETTDRHIRKCSEKQAALQKERDRLIEVNKIHESEIMNLKQFLSELSVNFQAFSSVKDQYAQKLSQVISAQRTVRHEILSLEGTVSDKAMCRLERAYASAMQDLAEAAMQLQRWAERCVARTASAERLARARPGPERGELRSAGLEAQLDELERCFRRLQAELRRAPADPAPDAHATVMEVRAEYEDKLNRMKAKMKQLYTEQIAVFNAKQKEEISTLERELARARDNWEAKSRKYEEHIRRLTSELWNVGEKLLMKKDEADWLRRQQRTGSLMSLQHVHSSGLVPPAEPPSRPSESHSLRSLPVCHKGIDKREGRGLHMSDEEGEVFDNRWLKELSTTPRRESDAGHRMSEAPGHRMSELTGHRMSEAPGLRLSELRWRNSLCPPHLKSSYPAETQFAPTIDEEDIKSVGIPGGKQQRKEVGITAYKKPGPPTPSKQAGRLSATDCELRESLRVEADPQPIRKTSTPSRIRSLFRSSARNDTAEGTPRKRLSNIFRKK